MVIDDVDEGLGLQRVGCGVPLRHELFAVLWVKQRRILMLAWESMKVDIDLVSCPGTWMRSVLTCEVGCLPFLETREPSKVLEEVRIS